MSWHAVDAVDDAVEATRRFLFPFSLLRWAKLALLVLLMGGGVSTNASVPVLPGSDGTAPEWIEPIGTGHADTSGIFDDGLSAALTDGGFFIGIVVGVLLVAAVFSVVSLSLRLVFYTALHTDDVRLWQPFVGRLRQAISLFVFSTAISAAAAAPVVLAVLVAVGTEQPTGLAPLDSLLATIASLPTGPTVAVGTVGAVFALSAFLVFRLTYEFVVPTMIVTDSGVIAGWKRAWRSLRGNAADVAVYLVVHFFIGIGISIFEGLTAVLVGSAVVVAAGIALVVVAGALGGLSSLIGTTAGIVSIVFVVTAALVALLLLLLPIRIVTRSYLINYEVSTLGGIDRSLALLHPDIDPAVPPDSSGS